MNLKPLSDSVHTADKWHSVEAFIQQDANVIETNAALPFKKLVAIRFLSENVLTFLLQWIGLMVSVNAPISFATGTACAFLFMRGFFVLPGIFLGNLFAYSLLSVTFKIALLAACTDVMQISLLVWFSFKYISPTLIFYEFKKFFQFFLMSNFFAAFFNFVLIHYAKMNVTQWLLLCLNHLCGIFMIAAAIVTWDIYFAQIHTLKKLNKKIFFYYALLMMNVIALTITANHWLIFIYVFIHFLLFMLLSFRLKWCGFISGIFLTSILLNLSYYLEATLFNNVTILILVQSVLLIEYMIGFIFTLI